MSAHSAMDEHRCWACGQVVAGAVCMGPHENLRAHPDWDDYVHLVAGRPGEVALPAAVVEFPLERQPGEAAKWSCGECGDVFGSRLELWAHVAKNDLMDLGEAIDAWIAEAVAS